MYTLEAIPGSTTTINAGRWTNDAIRYYEFHIV